MNRMTLWIQLAGALHLAVLLANFALPRKLAVRENLARVNPLIRQVFVVHWVYIGIVLLLFGVLCLAFPAELAGANALGRFLSAFLCAFWLLRIVLQLTVYDSATRRENRFLDGSYMLALGYFAIVFGIAAWR